MAQLQAGVQSREGASMTTLADTLKDARDATRSAMIKAALDAHKWNVSAVALDLGVSRATIHRAIRELRISRPEKPKAPARRSYHRRRM